MKSWLKSTLFALALCAAVPSAQAHFFSGLFSKGSVTGSDQNTISCTKEQAIGFGIFSLGAVSFTAFKFWEMKKTINDYRAKNKNLQISLVQRNDDIKKQRLQFMQEQNIQKEEENKNSHILQRMVRKLSENLHYSVHNHRTWHE